MAQMRCLTSLPAIHATIVKGALEAEGLTVVLQGAGFDTVYPLSTGTWATRLLVRDDEFEQAQQILGEFERTEG